jgi:hypothetical protein
VVEELTSVVDTASVDYLTDIVAPGYGGAEGEVFRMSCFAAALETEPVCAAEVEESRYFSEREYREEIEQAPAVLALFEWLSNNAAYPRGEI